MKRFALHSRLHGPQEFSVIGNDGYVKLNGRQVCVGGQVTGPTLTCNESDLERVARAWWRAALRSGDMAIGGEESA